MYERPDVVDDTTVLAAVREWWKVDVDAITYLPIGFGGHHWCASWRGEPRLFVTLEGLGFRHDLTSLGATYAATATLGFAFANANLEPWVVPLVGHALSVTPWLDGVRPAILDVVATTAMLDSLHAVTPPPGLRRWAPLVDSDLADRLTDAVRRPWGAGPFGEQARAAITGRLDEIEGWVAEYHRLADVARSRPWVTTHGQPGIHNQLLTSDGLRLVDWESLMLAPAERDLRTVGVGNDTMVDMFALEWRLDEVNIGATWLQAPHEGTGDDRETLENLREELGLPRRA